MIELGRWLLCIAVLAVSFPTWAGAISPGTYEGTLSCGVHLGTGSPGWTSPVRLVIDEDQLAWLRGGRDTRPEFDGSEFREVGKAKVSPAGMATLVAEGAYLPGSKVVGQWLTRGYFRLLGQDFIGELVQASRDNMTVIRQCQARFVVALPPASAGPLATGNAPLPMPSYALPRSADNRQNGPEVGSVPTSEFQAAQQISPSSAEMVSPPSDPSVTATQVDPSIATVSPVVEPPASRTVGTPPVVEAEPTIRSVIGWALVGAAALALPLLFLLASVGAHEELGLRVFFRNLNSMGRIDPFRAQTEASLILLAAFLAFAVTGPLIIWHKVVAPSIQRDDAQVRTICCLEEQPTVNADARLAVEVYQPGSFVSKLWSVAFGDRDAPRSYEMRIIDLQQGQYVDLRGAGGSKSVIQFDAKASSDIKVVFTPARIEIFASDFNAPTQNLIRAVEARQIGLSTIAVESSYRPPRLHAPDATERDTRSSESSGFAHYSGRIETVDEATGRRSHVAMPFDPKVVKASGPLPTLFITKKNEVTFLGSIFSIATGFQETTQVALVDASDGKVKLTDNFFGFPARYVAASTDGRRHILMSGKFLKIYKLP